MPQADSPQVSILIPIYNVSAYLAECLSSVLAQTFTDFEAICINDGSTDDSREIIEEFVQKDSRFKLVDKPNSGYGASMNRGLDEARGEYIAVLESDDLYDPQALELLYKAASDYQVEVAKANCYLYWSGPPVRRVLRHVVPRQQYHRLVNPQNENDIFYLPPSVWTALYRRDFLEQHDIRFTETPGASYQDTAFSFKVWFNARRVVYLPNALVLYRQDNQASSVNSSAKANCVIDEFAEMDRYISTRTIPDWLPGLKTKMKFDTYIWNYERLAIDLQLDFLLLMSRELALDLEQGRLDWQLFEDWNLIDLKLILDSPEEYHRQRLISGTRSNLSKARHYLRTGGLPLLAKKVWSKLFSRN